MVYVAGYIAFKFFIYVIWCSVGIRYLLGSSQYPPMSALQLGFIRILLSIIFGFLIGGFASTVYKMLGNEYLTYILVYTPARVVEWGIIAYLIYSKNSSNLTSQKSILWIIGGIFVSFVVTDVPVILILGGPFTGSIGRIFC